VGRGDGDWSAVSIVRAASGTPLLHQLDTKVVSWVLAIFYAANDQHFDAHVLLKFIVLC
jgi:hypothetical protein